MTHKRNPVLALVLAVVLSACQWRSVRHGALMPGIQSSHAAYERQRTSGHGQANEADSVRPSPQQDARDANQPAGNSQPSHAAHDVLLPAPLANSPEIRLERTGYTTSYNAANRICNWVAWLLTASHTSGSHQRKGMRFAEDTSVPLPRATHYDYMRSGYDRGHMCPAGDNKWDGQAMADCFLLTNICPQVHSLNAGDWNELEMRCRRWAKRYGAIHIVCGPILYRRQHKTIGANRVVVPEAFFKVVLCMEGTPKAIGFVYKNTDGNRPMGDYVNTVDEVERITGIDFFAALPDDVEEKVERTAHLDEWE